VGEGPVEVGGGEEGGVGWVEFGIEFGIEFEVVEVWGERNEADWCMQIRAVREGCFCAGELKRS
jgi:hypothetical protein